MQDLLVKGVTTDTRSAMRVVTIRPQTDKRDDRRAVELNPHARVTYTFSYEERQLP
jgi:hypothetical protein